ncbi:unnamed protein product [Microthlaspi erraticum]|uniref:F-box domain-containing protein n=1 Tax=Microthlaspi erraticum TaxID=1685480 RepID=A0A6D2LA40_9BRAS|nr:unnamed protein product [Microthlaspi erraticum]
MNSKKKDTGSTDRISNLPEALICHILSFLPTEDSAWTSLLSRKWRYLFAYSPNLNFDASVKRFHPGTSRRVRTLILSVLTSFVDRVLVWRGDAAVNKFSLKCGQGVDQERVNHWILNVLERGVSDLDLHVTLDGGPLPAKVFESKSLVRLRIESENIHGVDVKDVLLPKLKTLYLNRVMLGEAEDWFEKLLSGCHVLEELALINVYSDIWKRSVSSKTIKRLTLSCADCDNIPDTVWFDTPNVVYLDYSDYVGVKYTKVNFGSLVEARIDLKMNSDQRAHAVFGHLVGNARDFLMGICNVQTLYLSAHTLEVLTFCCESTPVFKNLIHLTIQGDKTGWESLPALLKNCPNLETLVFQGLRHRYRINCEDVNGCICNFSGGIPACLSSSPVKVLKIMRFGVYDGIENQMEQIKHFLERQCRVLRS